MVLEIDKQAEDPLKSTKRWEKKRKKDGDTGDNNSNSSSKSGKKRKVGVGIILGWELGVTRMDYIGAGEQATYMWMD